MIIRTLLASAVIGAGMTVAAGPAEAAAATCTPHTSSVASETAVQAIIKSVTANIAAACGFTISGTLLGDSFGPDGLALETASYDGHGNVHMIYLNQGVVENVYRIGGATYVRLYESAAPHAAPDIDVISMWHAYGVTSKAVIKAAGSSKWIKLTAAQEKTFHAVDGFGNIGSPASLATALAAGSGGAWTLTGTATYHSISCTILAGAAKTPDEPAQKLYIDTATGLPVAVKYLSGDNLVANFRSWSHTTTVTAPRRPVTG
jgi:hypothetical protein